jgi:hypothetical protein
VRSREDGAAASVFGPFGFLSNTLGRGCKLLVPGGIVMVFADWRRMHDLAYISSTVACETSRHFFATATGTIGPNNDSPQFRRLL